MVTELSTQAKGADDVYYTLTTPNGVDTDEDGYLDVIYAGDTRGSLWKFYYDDQTASWKKIKLFQTIDDRPITAKPILAFDTSDRLRIFFGTGQYIVGSDRARDVRNTFYCVVDTKNTDGHYTRTTLIKNDGTIGQSVVDLTERGTGASFDELTQSQKDDVNNIGWFFHLDPPSGPGERVFEEALVVSRVVFFTSFTPNQDICAFGGDSRLYAVDFMTGLPGRTTDYKNSINALQVLGEPPQELRYISLTSLSSGDGQGGSSSGVASKPVLYIDPVTKAASLIIQTSDTLVRQAAVNLDERPLKILYWKYF